MNKLGMIGCGAMGTAIVGGLIKNGLISSDRLFVFEPNREKTDQLKKEFGLNIVESINELTDTCQTIIIAVKPQVMSQVLEELKSNVVHHLLISIAAGITLSFLESRIHQAKIVRVMPNTPARFGMGVSVYAPGRLADNTDCMWVEQIFTSVGKVLKIPEYQMDAVTAVSGSGPAYVFHFIEAMIDAGVMLGLTRQDASVLVIETFRGATEMIRQTGEHPAKLKNEVTSPGGTTAAALYEFEKGALTGIMMNALIAGARRSAELGEIMEQKSNG